MRKINVLCVYGDKKNPTVENREEVVYNIEEIDIDAVLNSKVYKNKAKQEFYNVPCTFDIETSTVIPENEEDKPYGFMFHWQFCINGQVIFGRRWEEFTYLLNFLREKLYLGKKKWLVVYVHFLSFEFQFMNQFIGEFEIFATDKRQVLSVRADGIEFRCSYRLSNMPLAKFCESSEGVIHCKLDGEMFDYKKLRTPDTEMEEYELAYCYNDVAGLYECIMDRLKEDTLVSIPLTSTGYVRREVRKNCQNYVYRKNFLKYVLNVQMYSILRDMFRGGNCHANAYYVGKKLDSSNVGKVYSFDKQSSYIHTMACKYFPMGVLTLVKPRDKADFYNMLDNYCCMFRVEFYDIELKEFNGFPYIDLGHCKKYSNVIMDNGRIVSATFLEIAMTEIDFQIIEKLYAFKEFAITEMYISNRGQLPDEILEVMMGYFKDKCELKGIPEKQYFYVKQKNKLNSFYGMMVTAIAHIIHTYDVENLEWVEEVEDVKEALEKFFNSRGAFLAYQWGIYVTAHSRMELQRGIDIVSSNERNSGVYVDTDSVKFINEKYIAEFEQLNKDIIRECENNKIPAYVDYNGKRFYLGVWERENDYIAFKTFGAKKYAYNIMEKNKDTGELEESFHITVSGMSKDKGADVIGNIDNFILGKTYKNIGRTVSYYNDVPVHELEIDGCKFTSGSNCGIVDTTYTLGVTNEFLEYYTGVQIEGIAKID